VQLLNELESREINSDDIQFIKDSTPNKGPNGRYGNRPVKDRRATAMALGGFKATKQPPEVFRISMYCISNNIEHDVYLWLIEHYGLRVMLATINTLALFD